MALGFRQSEGEHLKEFYERALEGSADDVENALDCGPIVFKGEEIEDPVTITRNVIMHFPD